ncbi:MAG: hypothetical protein ACYTFI_04000 [Planctomycetota bacterium]
MARAGAVAKGEPCRCHVSSALKPACSKWRSPVNASVMLMARRTTNEMQSVNA